MVNLGVYYQSAHNNNACNFALAQLRKYYPYIPIVLFDDGTYSLSSTATKYSCTYRCDTAIGINTNKVRSNIGNITSFRIFMDRLYYSCINELSETEYIILYEDDVLCLRTIDTYPIYDISGNARHLYSPFLQNYLGEQLNISKTQLQLRHFNHPEGTLYGSVIRGGGIFNRAKFLECYNSINDIDWTKVCKLDINIVKYANIALCFLFQINGFSAGLWPEISEYKENVSYNSAFLHGYKKYYG